MKKLLFRALDIIGIGIIYFLIGAISLSLVAGFFTLVFYYFGYIILFLCAIIVISAPIAAGFIVVKVIGAVIETWGNK